LDDLSKSSKVQKSRELAGKLSQEDATGRAIEIRDPSPMAAPFFVSNVESGIVKQEESMGGGQVTGGRVCEWDECGERFAELQGLVDHLIGGNLVAVISDFF